MCIKHRNSHLAKRRTCIMARANIVKTYSIHFPNPDEMAIDPVMDSKRPPISDTVKFKQWINRWINPTPQHPMTTWMAKAQSNNQFPLDSPKPIWQLSNP